MTATLPEEIRRVFDAFITTEYVTVDRRGQPIAWPVTPYHVAERGWIDVTTGLGYPKKADDAARNPHVALLFSEPKGSGLEDPPMVLVQGTADVDDRDLDANRRRYLRDWAAKLPDAAKRKPPDVVTKLMGFYFTRIYVHVKPERVYVWPHGDATAEPQLYGARVEEVRSGHAEEPEVPRHAPEGGGSLAWDGRMAALGTEFPTGVLAIVGPDGFPFAVRLPLEPDRAAGVVRFGADPVGVPLAPGLACLTVHEHDERFTSQRNFQVRGDLVRDGDRWALVPHKLVGGFEMPKSNLALYRDNARKMVTMARRARGERARRTRAV